MAANSEKIASVTARIPKKVAMAAGALAVVAGCGGAYYYFVYLPQEQAAAKAATTVSPVPRKPPVAKAASPASGVPATPAVAKAGPASTAASAPAATMAPASAPVATTATTVPKPQLATLEKSKEPKTESDKNTKGGKEIAAVGKTDKKAAEATSANHVEPGAAAPVKATHKRVKARRPRHVRSSAPVAVVTDVVAPEPQVNVITTKFNDLITAVMYQDQAAVTELLDLGWWVDKPDQSGITPLMAAVTIGNAAMAELLLKRGANPNLVSSHSGSALRIAKRNRDAGMTTLLQSYGAKAE